MNINRLILVACLLSGFAAPGVAAQSTSPKAGGHDATNSPWIATSYRTSGFKKFASMFLDSKKGLLLLWYKK